MNSTYLEHHGIKGQRWGVRRFQNNDGSYTAAGKRRYDQDGDKKPKMSTAKKVAIGVGVAATAAATIYVANKANKVLVNSLSERTSKLGKSMVEKSHVLDMDAEKVMEYADRSKRRGSYDLESLRKDKASKMFKEAEQLRRDGFGLQIKARNKHFTRKELLGEAKQLRKDIKDTKNTNLKYFRRAMDMYDDFGRPNYDKKTMRNYEAWSRRNAIRETKKRYDHLLRNR